MSRAIRIDQEVKRMLDIERKPNERNYNAAILRILKDGIWRPRHLKELERSHHGS